MKAQVAVFGFTVSPTSYTYLIPSGLNPAVGQLVEVPFGRKFRFGVVTELSESAPAETVLKPIGRLVSPGPLLTPGQLDLARFISENYFVTLTEAIELMLPRLPKVKGSTASSHQSQELLLFPTLRQATMAQQKEGGVIFSHTLKPSQFDSTWEQISSGRAKRIFGPRTALFAPFKNLTRICIFQTESDVYKEERRPYYRTLALAQALARVLSAKLEAFSYSPRVQDEFEIKHTLKTLNPTTVQVVDLRRQGVVNAELARALAKHTGSRILFFLNRKSEKGPLVCRTCKQTSYTDDPSTCPNCGGADVKFQTFNLQTLAKKITPPEGAEVVWATQQIFFEETTTFDLVVVLSADTYLRQPSFSSSEKTFQMIISLRRLVKPGGEILVQTGFPDEPAIKLALRGDYRSFYRSELKVRRETGNPPFGKIVKITPPTSEIELNLPGLDIFGPFPGKKSPYFVVRGLDLSPLRDLPRDWKLDIDPLSI